MKQHVRYIPSGSDNRTRTSILDLVNSVFACWLLAHQSTRENVVGSIESKYYYGVRCILLHTDLSGFEKSEKCRKWDKIVYFHPSAASLFVPFESFIVGKRKQILVFCSNMTHNVCTFVIYYFLFHVRVYIAFIHNAVQSYYSLMSPYINSFISRNI